MTGRAEYDWILMMISQYTFCSDPTRNLTARDDHNRNCFTAQNLSSYVSQLLNPCFLYAPLSVRFGQGPLILHHRRFGKLAGVLPQTFKRRAIRFNTTGRQQDCGATEPPHSLQIVTDKQHGATFAARHLVHFTEAFLLKFGITDRKYLVD